MFDLNKPCEVYVLDTKKWERCLNTPVYNTSTQLYGAYFNKDNSICHSWFTKNSIRNVANYQPHTMDTILPYHNEMVFIDDKAIHFSNINQDHVVLGLMVWTYEQLAELTWATGPDVGKPVAVKVS